MSDGKARMQCIAPSRDSGSVAKGAALAWQVVQASNGTVYLAFRRPWALNLTNLGPSGVAYINWAYAPQPGVIGGSSL